MIQLKANPLELLNAKIKAILIFWGMNERYSGVKFLAKILSNMILHNNDNIKIFNSSILDISKTYQVDSQTAISSIIKVLAMCNNNNLTKQMLFSKRNTRIICKIRLIKLELLKELSINNTT